ncbi:hypothetical protein OG453_35955 [Streptomyces sp. NBC_01381]|uniref:DUF6777 domain-containing protein n=1 Tax=Streptomyces sp. NBC_01381 TaxID=2903845 RepID=UPI0022544505|nr:DUF6777 domain-containing protein [Streptomyces sp. NBC_01381]MCX4672013.1 hypothetical protein [Streptomyces sp. NBC_01381]
MRVPTRTYATAFAISMAIAVAGCSGGGEKNAADGGSELFMQPAAAEGPDPFTDSTATSTATPSPVTRSPQPAPSGTSSPTAHQGARSYSGSTPGLYGGTQSVGSCDVDAQVRFLTADQSKARAFAQVSGISQADIPGFLRGLTPVVLRADTRVTNHGYRSGQATGYQSVLQTGTAVLVDNRGLPRVRCACGNPLKPPVALQGTPSRQGQQWPGYRPTQVIVVTPAPKIITNITIVNIVNNTWIERKTGDHHGDHDHRVPPPRPTSTPTPSTATPSTPTPSTSPPTPSDSESSEPPTDPGTTSADCPTPSPATGTEPPSPPPPGCPTPTSATPSTDEPSTPEDDTTQQDPGDETGPDGPSLPDTPLTSDPGAFES